MDLRRRNNPVGSGYRLYFHPSEPHFDAQQQNHRNPKEELGSHHKKLVMEANELAQSDSDDLKQAAALLATSGAFLFEGLCESCSRIVRERLAVLSSGGSLDVPASDPDGSPVGSAIDASSPKFDGNTQVVQKVGNSPSSWKDATVTNPEKPEQMANGLRQEADGRRRQHVHPSAVSNNSTGELVVKMASHTLGGPSPYRTQGKSGPAAKASLLDIAGVNESTRLQQIKRKKDFVSMERVDGKVVNAIEGLELHTNVFTDAEQKDLIKFIYGVQELGRAQKLRKRTYSEPRKWMRGKGRVTIQFGCCYNYAVDRDGNPPGIIQDEEVDPMPEMLRAVIKRLVRWHVLPRNSVPDSCIINLYDVGDCIPPHIDHHDFVRPFCTVSLLSECNIVFGSKLTILGPGDFSGTVSIPLPMGSVLVLNGNGADVAMHAVPAVPKQRISITFRKMDPLKVPIGFAPDLELLGTEPLIDSVSKTQSAKLHPAEASPHTPPVRATQKTSQNGTEVFMSRMQSAKLHPAEAYLHTPPVRAPQKTSQNGVSDSPLFVLESDFPTLNTTGSGRKHRKSGS